MVLLPIEAFAGTYENTSRRTIRNFEGRAIFEKPSGSAIRVTGSDKDRSWTSQSSTVSATYCHYPDVWINLVHSLTFHNHHARTFFFRG